MQGLRMRARCTQGTKVLTGRWERIRVRDRARIPKATLYVPWHPYGSLGAADRLRATVPCEWLDQRYLELGK